jgi:hypothetical protein
MSGEPVVNGDLCDGEVARGAVDRVDLLPLARVVDHCERACDADPNNTDRVGASRRVQGGEGGIGISHVYVVTREETVGAGDISA